MNTPLYLGLDVGTSGVKAVLVDTTGELRYEASESYGVDHPAPLWAEQDPAVWWDATVAATRALHADRHERLSEKWRRYRRLYDYTRPLERDETEPGEPQ